ncbi:MAG: hypothetical protein AAF266_16910 [Planctomycetota bacterium]
MEACESKPKRRPRVSLLSLFLLTALVATSVTTGTLWREIRPLRSEVLRLRVETGQLTVDDPAKLHALAIDTMDEDTWKWRVYLPEGPTYRIATKIGRIKGITSAISKAEWFAANGSNCSTTLEPGEFVVTVKLERDPTHPNGERHWNVRTRFEQTSGPGVVASAGGVRTGGGRCGTVVEWLGDRRSRSWSSDAPHGRGQAEREAEAGLELLTIRRSAVTELPSGWSATAADSTKEGDGIGLWIVPESREPVTAPAPVR